MDRRMVGEEGGVTMTEKKKFQVPHSMAIIVAAMILASILTYLIPGGNFERVVNDAGKTVVVPGSFTYVEQTPVNPLTILDYVFSGLTSAGSIIFALLCAGGGLGIVLATGLFQGAACTFSKKAKGKELIICLSLGLWEKIQLLTMLPIIGVEIKSLRFAKSIERELTVCIWNYEFLMTKKKRLFTKK